MASEAGKGDKRRPTDQNVFSNNYDIIFKKNLSQERKPVESFNYLSLAKQHMTKDRFGIWSVTDVELQNFAEAVAKEANEKA
jgi:hypothetical protein